MTGKKKLFDLSNWLYFTEDKILEAAKNGLVVDGTFGGLLFGPSHSEGGILVIRKILPGIYMACHEFEGWEYILSKIATQANSEVLKKINSEKPINRFSKYKIPFDTPILDVRLPIGSPYLCKVLYLDNSEQFIMNRKSTKENINFLNKLALATDMN